MADILLPPWDLLSTEEYNELQAAQDIMREILDFAKLSEESLSSLVNTTGPRWFECGEEMLLPWTKKNRGKSIINVP